MEVFCLVTDLKYELRVTKCKRTFSTGLLRCVVEENTVVVDNRIIHFGVISKHGVRAVFGVLGCEQELQQILTEIYSQCKLLKHCAWRNCKS